MNSIECKMRLYKEQGTGVFLALSLCHHPAPLMVPQTPLAQWLMPPGAPRLQGHCEGRGKG